MRVVVALGGNALLKRGEPMTAENQRTNVRSAAPALASVAILAGLALGILADGQAKAADGQLDPGIQEVLDSRVEVYQAQGMIKADLGVTVIEAIALLRAHAYSVGRPLTEVARDVVEGVLRLAH